jgi:hypothetical protein
METQERLNEHVISTLTRYWPVPRKVQQFVLALDPAYLERQVRLVRRLCDDILQGLPGA